jgi:hypothetical protein
MFKSKEDFDKIFQSNKVINILNTLYNSIFWRKKKFFFG